MPVDRAERVVENLAIYRLYTEELQPGMEIDGLTIVDPFESRDEENTDS